eukprot:gene4682-853_t
MWNSPRVCISTPSTTRLTFTCPAAVFPVPHIGPPCPTLESAVVPQAASQVDAPVDPVLVLGSASAPHCTGALFGQQPYGLSAKSRAHMRSS